VDARNPIEQMLRLVLPKFESGRSHKRPEAFKKQAPHFFEFLRRERGLSVVTIRAYCIQLHIFEPTWPGWGQEAPRPLATPY